MPKTYRLGAAGFAHGHIFALIRAFAELPNVEWVAAADTVPAVPSLNRRTERSLQRMQDLVGPFKVYDDYREMLDKEQMDIVLFCPENSRHGEVAEAIAAQGAHMMTEKPMSASLADALRMWRAAQADDVRLFVNWPTTWSPGARTVKRLIDEGAIGRVLEVKWRNGGSMGPMSYSDPEPPGTVKGAEWWHQAAPGGGAMLDYCCYGSCLSRWYIGEQAVAANGIKANLNSHYGDADDNAVMSVRFPNAMAVLEATWTTWTPVIPSILVYGEKGAITVGSKPGADPHDRAQVVNVYTTRSHSPIAPDLSIDPDPLPEGRETLAKEFIHHIETGEPLHPTVDPKMNLEIMAILDAGIRSAKSGKLETVDDITWCIG